MRSKHRKAKFKQLWWILLNMVALLLEKMPSLTLSVRRIHKSTAPENFWPNAQLETFSRLFVSILGSMQRLLMLIKISSLKMRLFLENQTLSLILRVFIVANLWIWLFEGLAQTNWSTLQIDLQKKYFKLLNMLLKNNKNQLKRYILVGWIKIMDLE